MPAADRRAANPFHLDHFDPKSLRMSRSHSILSAEAIRWLGVLLGCGLAAVILFAPNPDPARLAPAAQRLAAVTVLMATLWLTQAIPIAATSLVPLALFPLLGIQPSAAVSKSYINSSIFLFLGGFIVALGIEKWGLHRRIALHIIRLLGAGPRRMVLGFMLATGFLSMWISNTASTLLMLPIGLALLTSLEEVLREGSTTPAETSGTADRQSDGTSTGDDRVGSVLRTLSVALMLGIAYSASLGGLTTLVGTPTNIAFREIWRKSFVEAPPISAGNWMTTVVPIGGTFLLVVWAVLVARLPALPGAERLGRRFFTERLHALGKPTRPELTMLVIFVTTALLWVFRTPLEFGGYTLTTGWGPWLSRQPWLLETARSLELSPRAAASIVDDGTVAMSMAVLMFLLPAGRSESGESQRIMDWQTAERLPWGILLLIGGGFALAGGFQSTGLSRWLGDWFAGQFVGWPLWLIVGTACLMMTFLTEFTSNVATISAILPVLIGAAVSLGIDPRLIAFPAAISTSCAFMLPIATPPNAIVFGSGRVRMTDMVRFGILINLIGVVLITLAAFLVLTPQMGISLDEVPSWAVPK